MKKPTADEMLAFIQAFEASLTNATSEPPARRWRCYVYPRTFATPDIRERSSYCGFGRTAIIAIVECMKDQAGLKSLPSKARKK